MKFSQTLTDFTKDLRLYSMDYESIAWSFLSMYIGEFGNVLIVESGINVLNPNPLHTVTFGKERRPILCLH